jgi:hypothetical protein
MDEGLTLAERRQVEQHRRAMEAEIQAPVHWEEAKADWLAHHAAEWRKRRQEHMCQLQREEIARYRWIACEKAQRDIGRQAAVEWVQKHAANWRKWYEETFT